MGYVCFRFVLIDIVCGFGGYFALLQGFSVGFGFIIACFVDLNVSVVSHSDYCLVYVSCCDLAFILFLGLDLALVVVSTLLLLFCG